MPSSACVNPQHGLDHHSSAATCFLHRSCSRDAFACQRLFRTSPTWLSSSQLYCLHLLPAAWQELNICPVLQEIILEPVHSSLSNSSGFFKMCSILGARLMCISNCSGRWNIFCCSTHLGMVMHRIQEHNTCQKDLAGKQKDYVNVKTVC